MKISSPLPQQILGDLSRTLHDLVGLTRPSSPAAELDAASRVLSDLGKLIDDFVGPQRDYSKLSSPSPSSPVTQGQPSAPSSPSPNPNPTPGSANPRDPASFFLTQNKTRYNPGGSVNANCGPTSLAMACLAFHKLPPGSSRSNPEGLIENVRRAMCNGVDNIHASTTSKQILTGARKLGLSASSVGGMADLNRALAAGKMVVALGNPGAYGKHPGGHFILVTGRAKDGGYIINDPVYTGRPGVVLSARQMAHYLWSGTAVGA